MSRIPNPLRMGNESPFLFDDDGSRYSTAVGLWTPSTLGAKAKTWWNADDHGTANMTDDGAGLISAWKDRIAGLSLTATTTARPTWGAAAVFSSKAGVTFDGVANCLVATSFAALPTGNNDSEVWTILNCGANASTGVIFQYGSATAGLYRRLQRNSTTHPAISDGSTSLIPNDDLTGDFIIGAGWTGSTTESGRLNGQNMVPATATISALNTGTSRVRMGAGNSTTASNFLIGTIRHVVVTSGLTANERLQMEGWLAWDSGKASLLPSDHAFKNWAP